MTIAVTGANGFIGGAIVRRLISQGVFLFLSMMTSHVVLLRACLFTRIIF